MIPPRDRTTFLVCSAAVRGRSAVRLVHTWRGLSPCRPNGSPAGAKELTAPRGHAVCRPLRALSPAGARELTAPLAQARGLANTRPPHPSSAPEGRRKVSLGCSEAQPRVPESTAAPGPPPSQPRARQGANNNPFFKLPLQRRARHSRSRQRSGGRFGKRRRARR